LAEILTDTISNQKLVYFPSSHNQCFCTT